LNVLSVQGIRGLSKICIVSVRNDEISFWLRARVHSLDSKYWFSDRVPACNGYENILEGAWMKPDISYFLNKKMEESGVNMCCINTAIEESRLAQREGGVLLPQDAFIRDNIGPDDTLLVSVGGNDIALAPSATTAFNMGLMLVSNDVASLRKHGAKARGMKHFVGIFLHQMKAYIELLTAKTRPKRVIVACIYFLDQKRSGGWAGECDCSWRDCA
jgi:hypothetical protein